MTQNYILRMMLFITVLGSGFVTEVRSQTTSRLNSFDTYLDSRAKITPQFDKQFPTSEEKRNFRRLREFKQRIDDDLLQAEDQFGSMEARFYRQQSRLSEANRLVRTYDSIQDTLTESIISTEKLARITDDDEVYYLPTPQLSANFITDRIGNLRTDITRYEVEISKIDTTLDVLRHNIFVLGNEKRLSESAIDNALAPEYKEQDFRKGIATAFSVVLGVLIVTFFGVLSISIFKAPEKTNAIEILFSTQGLQFITIFVLIIAIILFGVLGILEGRELAAILAGISGYILGRGIEIANASKKPPATTPPPAPTSGD